MKKELDCRGLECPQPVIRCRAALQEESPDSLEVVVDNMAAVENVSRFLASRGYKARADKKGDREWRIIAEREEGAGLEAADSVAKGAKTLVLITTETLGRGDEALGAKLMANFLGSLAELGDALWRIILLNGGVKLAALKGTALDHLKSLENDGVSVLVCGTCLNHYGLLEQKEAGETTNMLDVVTSLALADKIIRP